MKPADAWTFLIVIIAGLLFTAMNHISRAQARSHRSGPTPAAYSTTRSASVLYKREIERLRKECLRDGDSATRQLRARGPAAGRRRAPASSASVELAGARNSTCARNTQRIQPDESTLEDGRPFTNGQVRGPQGARRYQGRRSHP
jgi:hypothetical protein